MIEILIAAALAGTIAWLLGWNAAVRNHRRNMASLQGHIADMEQQVAAFNEAFADDPQRASIDMGKRYAVNQVQATLNRLSAEVPR